jgi:hypothetical protein
MPLMSNIYLLPDYGKGEGKGGRLRGKDFLFMMVSICQYLFFVVIIKE